eukprot:XP_011676556.1 PREDICTED: uncharacterized protein LOC105444253 [Strongylocentrotus purpuratus]
MNHNSMRNQNTKTFAKLHYNKAIKLFEKMDSPGELLRKELERVALLLEHQVENQGREREALQDEALPHVPERRNVRGGGHMTKLACSFQAPEPEPDGAATHETCTHGSV